MLQIWGKLQKVRKALQKSLPKSADDDVSNVHDSDRTTESTVTTVKSKKPRSFKTSAFNFATFRRRFNRLEIPASRSQPGALPLAISTNTGMDESLERDVGLDSSTSNSVDSMAVADNNEREPNRRVPDSAIPNRQRAALGCIRQNEGYRFSISSDAMDDDLDDLEEDDDVMEEFEIDSRVLSKLSSQPNLFPQLPPPKLPSVISFDTEPYIPEQNLMPKLIHIYEKFADVFAVDDVVNIPLLRLMELRKYLTTLPYIEQFFEAIPIGNLIHFSTNIVETILHLIDDLDDVNDTVVRHVRFYTRFLCTCGLQSQKFRSTFERHSALHWFAMLRFEPIRYDIINSFCHFTPELLSLYTDDTFFVFLTETVANYQYLPDYDQQRRYIIHYVARLAQTYPMLLYRAYQEFNRSVFNEFLLIMERVVRFDHLHIDAKREPPLLPTAVQFIVKFFDMAIDDFKDERSDYHMLVTRLCRLMDIMTNVIKNLPSFRHIFETPALMHNVCALQNLLVKGDEIINDLPTSHRQPFIVRARPTVSRDFDDAALSNSAGSSSVDGDISPPERKYPRLSISNDGTNVYERPGTSMRLFPLPSPEIVSVDATTSFRSRNAFLSLFEQRKISRFYIVNLKRSTMGLVGALCCASAEHRNIAAEYKIIEAIFKTARISELMKHDYGPVIKRTLIEICTKHVKNTEALSKIEQLPSHLVTKDDILPLLTSANETH